ncbi:hypothetical protein LC605_17440 [Nostoc sp. CHAB 5836]|uniref:hypothetical protein n=1 Tax=Nostoc sp. CHAB 5836 TaxID=2780404 RepID=UPI001E4EFC12|nr:hypothetical protein [Nostoc sp. CHAB 5836]MCC5616826.1 hypothetical protein [Nostoc sp. CHAB 5836]
MQQPQGDNVSQRVGRVSRLEATGEPVRVTANKFAYALPPYMNVGASTARGLW